jgi:hypothetical protein
MHSNIIIPIGAEVTINEKEKSMVVSEYLKWKEEKHYEL